MFEVILGWFYVFVMVLVALTPLILHLVSKWESRLHTSREREEKMKLLDDHEWWLVYLDDALSIQDKGKLVAYEDPIDLSFLEIDKEEKLPQVWSEWFDIERATVGTISADKIQTVRMS